MKQKKITSCFIVAFITLIALILSGAANATPLINGLGGPAGFGEYVLPRNDDGSSSEIDISSVFPNGLNFFGTTYYSLYVNNNGNITFTDPLWVYTPEGIAGINIPIIAPFWADVDTRGGVVSPTPGGTSTGSNLVYWDLDTTNHIFTVTWDDVGYFDEHTSPVNAFQLRLIEAGPSPGDFDIEFIWEDINWTTGDASGGTGGLGGFVARAGWSAGDTVHFFEIPQSGNQDAMLNLDNNPGYMRWEVRNGIPHPAPVPEPTTMSLVGIGLLGVIFIMRKRVKKYD